MVSQIIPGYGSAWLERIVRDDEVAGSNPVTPTRKRSGLVFRFFFIYLKQFYPFYL